MTYNDWSNRETWTVNLWLANDESLYDGARDMAQHATNEYALAYALKDWINELMPELPGLWSDLLNSALSNVNWDEIAKHWYEDEQ